MKLNVYKWLKPFVVLTGVVSLLAACNKDNLTPEPIAQPAPASTSIIDALNDPDFTILKAAVTRAGANLTALLSDKAAVYTFFAPANSAFQAIGITSPAAVAAFRPGQLDTLLRYALIGGQLLTAEKIPTSFPNAQEPSSLVLAAPSASLPPGLRMSIFPSKRGITVWVNNIPVIQADILAGNSVIHKVPVLVAPPSQFLWNRINADPDLTYLKAAIQRADSGAVAASSLQAALLNPAANLTVFAPTDAAFKQILTGQITLALIPLVTAQMIPVITQQLIAGGATPEEAAAQAPMIAQQQAPAIAQGQAATLAATPDVFQNPALFGALSAQTVKGLVVYHLLGSRAFTVNFPTTPASVPTLLNSAIPAHPGVTLQANFGATGVTDATVKGAANPTASNLLINPTPAPAGTSDQLYINGVLHKIDQVLRPQ
jgi:uncharacterized surface protein with fasciclin (FAS1) repeats